MNGFIVTLPSSAGVPCFFVTPELVGQKYHPHYPWGRATFMATVFPTAADAQSALDRMVGIHRYIAPELSGGLGGRLTLAQIVPAASEPGLKLAQL